MTTCIETLIILAFFSFPNNNRNSLVSVKRIILTGLVASGTTLPFVWYVIPLFIQNRTNLIIIAELFAFIVEIPIIKRFLRISWRKAMIVSLLANSTSFLFGYLFRITT